MLMADNVLDACRGYTTVVACDDDEVANWAEERNTEVFRSDGLDLNHSVAAATDAAGERGWRSVVVLHADLPLVDSLAAVLGEWREDVLLVADRRRDGTNLLRVPTDAGFGFRFGPGSFRRHRGLAVELGLSVRELVDEAFAWDIDEPDDLILPFDAGGATSNFQRCVEEGLLRVADQSTSNDPAFSGGQWRRA